MRRKKPELIDKDGEPIPLPLPKDSMGSLRATDRWGIRALSLTAPWGSLMAWGLKKNETRSWAPFLLVPFYLAIHQTKSLDSGVLDETICNDNIMREICRMTGQNCPRYHEKEKRANIISKLPRGRIVAIAKVSRILSTNTGMGELKLTEEEAAFGNYSENRYAWVTTDVLRLEAPIEAKGSQGLWPWEPPQFVKNWIINAEG